jgi:hypothetical protein
MLQENYWVHVFAFGYSKVVMYVLFMVCTECRAGGRLATLEFQKTENGYILLSRTHKTTFLLLRFIVCRPLTIAILFQFIFVKNLLSADPFHFKFIKSLIDTLIVTFVFLYLVQVCLTKAPDCYVEVLFHPITYLKNFVCVIVHTELKLWVI